MAKFFANPSHKYVVWLKVSRATGLEEGSNARLQWEISGKKGVCEEVSVAVERKNQIVSSFSSTGICISSTLNTDKYISGYKSKPISFALKKAIDKGVSKQTYARGSFDLAQCTHLGPLDHQDGGRDGYDLAGAGSERGGDQEDAEKGGDKGRRRSGDDVGRRARTGDDTEAGADEGAASDTGEGVGSKSPRMKRSRLARKTPLSPFRLISLTPKSRKSKKANGDDDGEDDGDADGDESADHPDKAKPARRLHSDSGDRPARDDLSTDDRKNSESKLGETVPDGDTEKETARSRHSENLLKNTSSSRDAVRKLYSGHDGWYGTIRVPLAAGGGDVVTLEMNVSMIRIRDGFGDTEAALSFIETLLKQGGCKSFSDVFRAKETATSLKLEVSSLKQSLADAKSELEERDSIQEQSNAKLEKVKEKFRKARAAAKEFEAELEDWKAKFLKAEKQLADFEETKASLRSMQQKFEQEHQLRLSGEREMERLRSSLNVAVVSAGTCTTPIASSRREARGSAEFPFGSGGVSRIPTPTLTIAPPHADAPAATSATSAASGGNNNSSAANMTLPGFGGFQSPGRIKGDDDRISVFDGGAGSAGVSRTNSDNLQTREVADDGFVDDLIGSVSAVSSQEDVLANTTNERSFTPVHLQTAVSSRSGNTAGAGGSSSRQIRTGTEGMGTEKATASLRAETMQSVPTSARDSPQATETILNTFREENTRLQARVKELENLIHVGSNDVLDMPEDGKSKDGSVILERLFEATHNSNTLRTELEATQRAVEILKKENEGLQQRLTEIAMERDQVDKLLVSINAEHTKIATEYETLEKKSSGREEWLSNSLEEKRKVCAELETQLQQAVSANEEASTMIKNYVEKFSTLMKEKAALEEKNSSKNARIKALEDELASAQKASQQLDETTKQDWEKVKQGMESKFAQEMAQLQSQLDAQRKKCSQMISVLRSANRSASAVPDLKKQVELLTEENKSLREKILELEPPEDEATMLQLRARVAELEGSLEVMHVSSSKLQGENAVHVETTRRLEASLMSAEKKLREQEHALAELADCKSRLSSEAEVLRSRVDDAAEDEALLAELSTANKQLARRVQDLTTSREAEAVRAEELQRENAMLDTQVAEYRKRVAECVLHEQQIRELRSANDSLRRRLIRDDLDTLQATWHQSNTDTKPRPDPRSDGYDHLRGRGEQLAPERDRNIHNAKSPFQPLRSQNTSHSPQPPLKTSFEDPRPYVHHDKENFNAPHSHSQGPTKLVTPAKRSTSAITGSGRLPSSPMHDADSLLQPSGNDTAVSPVNFSNVSSISPGEHARKVSYSKLGLGSGKGSGKDTSTSDRLRVAARNFLSEASEVMKSHQQKDRITDDKYHTGVGKSGRSVNNSVLDASSKAGAVDNCRQEKIETNSSARQGNSTGEHNVAEKQVVFSSSRYGLDHSSYDMLESAAHLEMSLKEQLERLRKHAESRRAS